MSDAEFIASLDAITEPRAMLACLVEHIDFAATSDPYYRDLTAALWRAARRVLANTQPTDERTA